MSTVAFDTHNFVKRLTAAGMPEPQAEVLAEEQTNLIENNLASKRDLKELETALKLDIGLVRRDLKELEVALKHDLKALKGDIELLRRDMTIRLGGMLVVAVGAFAALVKLL